MALSLVSVNWASLFANGTLTAVSAGTTWTNAARLADFFLSRLAKTAIAPTGLTEIKIDQGATVANYVSPNRLIIPAGHNIDAGLSLKYNATDTWGGTEVTLSPTGTPTSGSFFSGTFPKVVAGTGNRWWRLAFQKTDAALQIGELWLTEQIVLGQSETTAGEKGYNVERPADFPILPNIAELRTLEGVRSAVEQGTAMRSMMLSGVGVSASSFADWEGLINGVSQGLRPFYVDDPRGATWLGAFTEIPRSLTDPERWDVELRVTEIP